MKLFKTLALAAALALAGLSSAHAAVESGVTFLTDTESGDPGDLTKLFYFDDTALFDSNSDIGGLETRTAGDTFDDYFIFNIPDDAFISFTALADLATGLGISFTQFDLVASGFGDVPDFTTGATTGLFVTGGGVELTSGTYALELQGTFLLDGGDYYGVLVAAPVPEPTHWALMLAGIGALGVIARRRAGGKA
jgi:hypothetical protein